MISIGLRVTGIALGYAAHILLSRRLGLHGYGQYVVALSCVLVLVLPAKLGFDYSALRYATTYLEGSRHGALRGFIRVSVVTIAGVSSLIGVAIVAVGRSLGRSVDYATLLGAATLIMPLALLVLLSALMRVARHFLASQFYDQVLRAAILVILIGASSLLTAHLDVSAALILTSLAAWISLGALALHFRATYAGVRSAAPSYADVRGWFALSAPLLGIAISQELLNQVEIIMLGALADSRAAGLFAAASRLVGLISFGLAASGIVSGPLIASAYHRRDIAELKYITRFTTRLALAFACVVAVILVVGGRTLLGFFGAEFQEAFRPMMILIAGALLNAFTGVVVYLLTLTGRERAALLIFLGSLGLSFGMNLVLIPSMGATGAAIASTAGLAFWNVAMLIYVRRVLGIDASAFGWSPRRKAL